MTVLVTGTAGFIGFHTARRLLAAGRQVVGYDVVNAYYDPAIKEARLAILRQSPNFVEVRADLADKDALDKVFAEHKPRKVINLAAQAGVRYSVENPSAYINSNLVGFANILECCRDNQVEHLVYASTSSVYGANSTQPFSETHGTAHPMSLYAATKKANEVMAHSYAHLFGLPCTGLRFFTVYGPWGRPDMALFKFTKGILAGKPIDIYNHGEMARDFTYVDDIVEGILRVLEVVPTIDANWDSANPSPGSSGIAPYRLYNIGRGQPVLLLDFVKVLEKTLGKTASLNMMDMQPGDVASTRAEISALQRDTGYAPSTSIETGVPNFVAWYRDYFSV
ncbi:NAD-dependent epimerase [Youhaiella tibetensis]|jgi:UDP-glucuronate 4-epimerase|uniref:NAD-dependent epimerase n=1 Tax=Paradevosia tibetensis TaxID=1447062 RepID=A0A5B9DIS8_9HYPH|nr:NAD-dependent epimerase [Youhaiella tibetensis]QEE18725.1 NAD-dependent epimerase [Youhaiella tibetensis]GGF39810.1 NAD-dependent epimerase [Youhaiella tibetensis]